MSLGLSLLAGCGQSISTSIGTAPHASGRQGSVYGGQQPIVGSSIQLYAVGTAGDGSAATPLFATPVTSDGSGSFTFGAYTCPSANTLVYLVATGGNPGLPGSANNTALALMAALGPCGNLNASTFINVNEVTTVSSVFPLAPYMASLDHIGSGASDAAALSSAFGVVNELANFRTGTVPGPALMAGYGVSTSQINTLADIMASCINSAGGVSGDGSACGSLFQYTGGNATTNTIAAAIQIAKNPTANTTQLFDLVQAQGPFQPTLSAAPSAFIASVLPQAPLPQFTPGTGAAFPITVSITASVGGSRVYYTTDGSTPTPGSTLYTVPFTIVGPTTVKAIAVVPGYANSPVSSIGYGVPVPGFTVKVVDVCSPRTGDSCAPQGLAVNPTTNTVYISGLSRGGNPINPPSDPTIPNLTILDGNTDTVSSFIATDLDSPYAVAVNPVTNKIYIGNAGAGDFLVMDGYTNTFTSLSLGYQGVAAGSLVLNPSTNTIYVNSAGTLYVVDGASSTLTTTIPVGTPLNSSMAINQVTDNLFVGGSAKANFLSINAATNSIVDAFTVAVQRTPYPVALNSVTNKVYLGAASLIVYDPVTLGTTLISSVSNCDALVVNPITNTIYALNSTGVSIIDGATNTVISTLPIADFTIRYDIGQLVIDPSLNKLYVISTYGVGSFTNNTASIAVLDLSTNTPSIIVGQQGTSGIGNAVLNPTTHKLYLEEEPNSIVIVSPT